MAFLPPSSSDTSRGPGLHRRRRDRAAGGHRPGEADTRTDARDGRRARRPARRSRARLGPAPRGRRPSTQAVDERLGARGRVLGRLEHDAVAGEQRREALPRRDGHREVPRRDHPDDADGLAGGPRQLVRAARTARPPPSRRGPGRRRSGPCRPPPARRPPPRRAPCRPREPPASASSALRPAMTSAAADDDSARAGTGRSAHARCAAAAAATASSTAAAAESGNVATTSSGRAGLTESKVAPAGNSTWPPWRLPIRFPIGCGTPVSRSVEV